MLPAILLGAGKTLALQKSIGMLSKAGGGLGMASGVLQSYSDMKSAQSSNPLNMLANPGKAIQGFASNQLLKGLAGKAMSDGMSLDLFNKDDQKNASNSLEHYQNGITGAVGELGGKVLNAAEKGAFGPKGMIVAKVAKSAIGFLNSKEQGEQNLNTELKSQAFDVPLPNAIKQL